jgi:hypothetical protein
MRKIKLLKDHEQDGILFKAGETIEVSIETYNWLMSVYLDERKKLVQQLNEIKIFGDEDDQ